jgi:hypothetical protein
VIRRNACPLLYPDAVQHRRLAASRARSHGKRPQLGRGAQTEPAACHLTDQSLNPVRAENLVHGTGQQSCSPCRLAVMITGHVPVVHVPPDHAATLVAAARPA